MEKIASFKVDHTLLEPGIYLSREDGDIKTWDIRMRRPNCGNYLPNATIHTIEHLVATYARNSRYKDGVVYFGPMGCRTGFYLLTRGLTDAEVLELTKQCFEFVTTFSGKVPGATLEECGNCSDHDLSSAKWNAKAYLETLEMIPVWKMRYDA